MKGYAIFNIEVKDDAAFRSVHEGAPAVAEAHGGKYLVRGGPAIAVQGNWTPHRIVVIEFDSVEQAKGWQKSPEYAELEQILNKSSNSDMVIVEGV